MQKTMCKAAQQEWVSLFTTEMECLWNTEPTDIRMIVIIHHILKKELKRVETSINEKIKKLKHKSKLTLSLDKSVLESTCELSPTRTSPESIALLEQSPKIKRHRKINREKNVSSPSLMNNAKESYSSSFSLLNPVLKASDEGVAQSTVTTDLTVYEPNDSEVINSSILNDSTDLSCSKSKIFKTLKPKKTGRLSNKSHKSILTLTQLIGDKGLSSNASTVNKTSRSAIENDGNKSNKLFKPTEKTNLFRNYDSVPVKKTVIPEHPHKTETVRCKADRLKLPGWSCKECQEYYEGFDLDEEELREKMKVCSKHRNNFDPFNDTPKGFWDVTIFSSQDD